MRRRMPSAREDGGGKGTAQPWSACRDLGSSGKRMDREKGVRGRGLQSQGDLLRTEGSLGNQPRLRRQSGAQSGAGHLTLPVHRLPRPAPHLGWTHPARSHTSWANRVPPGTSSLGFPQVTIAFAIAAATARLFVVVIIVVPLPNCWDMATPATLRSPFDVTGEC